jgi:hypothetical protein
MSSFLDISIPKSLLKIEDGGLLTREEEEEEEEEEENLNGGERAEERSC